MPFGCARLYYNIASGPEGANISIVLKISETTFERILMDELKKDLREGVRRFITRYSPGEPCPAEAEFNTSSHPFVEMCFVISGTSRYMLNNMIHELEPGTCVFIEPGVSHSFGYREEDHDLCHLWLYLNGGLWANLIGVGEGGMISRPLNMFSIPPGYADIVIRRLRYLENEPVNDENAAVFLSDPVNGVLLETAFQLEHRSRPDGSEDPIALVIHAVKTHILSCNARNCSYQDLEHVSGFSRSYLAHCFRARTGMSIGEFIDEVRVDYTIKGRRQGMTQKEIACELGFASPVSYWSWLRKHKDRIS